jgi:protein-S-isoprenylcysteine O-methyltransferase
MPAAGQIISSVWVIVGAIWLISGIVSKASIRRQSAKSRLLQAVPVILGYILLWDRDYSMGLLGLRFIRHSPAVDGIAVALAIGGAAFALWARFYLGGNWSAAITVKQDHQLVCNGPYAVVRHPIYTGFLCAILGTALYVGQVRGLVAVALAFIGWKLKSIQEESFMREQFGSEYDAYSARVKGLIPFIW